MKVYKDHGVSESDIEKIATETTDRVFYRVAIAVNSKHAGAYLQPLFKNAQKCKELLEDSDPSSIQFHQIDMFAKV